MEDYLHVYDSADNPDQRKGSGEGDMYMVPLKPHQENQYEQPQVSVLSLSKMEVPANECISQHQNDQHQVIKRKKKASWFIVISVLITVCAMVALIALAIGVLSFNAARQDRSSRPQFGTGPVSGAISEESINYTNLVNEISALNILVGQLYSDTQRNISQLFSVIRVSNGSSTFVNLSQQLMMVQNEVSLVNERQSGLSSDISAAQHNIASVSRQISTARGDITSVSSTMNQQIRSIIGMDIRSISSTMSEGFQSLISTNIQPVSSRINSQIIRSVSSLNTRINSVSSSLNTRIRSTSSVLGSRITSSVNRLSTVVSRLSNPYQNCYQVNRSCQIDDSLMNNNKRLYCSTPALAVDRTVCMSLYL